VPTKSRDRIVHCATFSRAPVQDAGSKSASQNLRCLSTRLNHVLRVAQIARGLARLLGAARPYRRRSHCPDLGHPLWSCGGASLETHYAVAVARFGNANVHPGVVDRVEAAFIAFRGLNSRSQCGRYRAPSILRRASSFGEFVGDAEWWNECQIVDVADVFCRTCRMTSTMHSEGGYLSFHDLDI